MAEAGGFPLYNVESEQSVIGGILLDNTGYDRCADLISADDFYIGDHQIIFRAIGRMLLANRPVDTITLAEELERAGDLGPGRDLATIGGLAQNTPSAVNIRTYATVVKDRALMRRMNAALGNARELLAAPMGLSAAELIDQVQAAVFAVTEGAKQSAGFKDMQSILAKAVERIDMMYNRDSPSDVVGVPTGFLDLDKQTGGFQPGDLITVGGRPSMGKSAFALNIAEHVALVAGLPVGIFSLEMPEEQLATRILASVGRLNHFKMRKGLLHDDDWVRLSDGVRKLVAAPIFIDETSGISPIEIRVRARRLFRQFGKLGLIVVDYLQLMQGDIRTDNRAFEIGTFSRGLKNLAKELDCPVLALSQVNRGVESRPNKRPNMSDLRESGDIEQDSDIVLFLYRDEVYKPESPDKGTAEVIIAKQRNGPIGNLRLTFKGEFMRFENHIRDVL